MDFIQTSNKQADKFGSGKHGFKAGNPGAGEQATYLDPEWCDNVQQEIVNVIEGAGAAINPVAKNQMYTAIQTLIANAINAASNPDYKLSVRVATTANIASLAGGAPNTLDGVALVANDRVLVKDQSTGSQNGIYYVSTLGTGADGTWTRATDADGAGELSAGTVVAVEEGTASADTLWMLTTDGSITIGTTVLTFVRKDAVTIPDASETVKGKVELADASEAAAGTDTGRALTPAGLRSGLNASGAAPIYACRAWVNFNGTGTVAIRASGNVSSITDNGTGDYTVNFSTALPDANYSVVGTASYANTEGWGFAAQTTSMTTGSCRGIVKPSGAGTQDTIGVYVAVFR